MFSTLQGSGAKSASPWTSVGLPSYMKPASTGAICPCCFVKTGSAQARREKTSTATSTNFSPLWGECEKAMRSTCQRSFTLEATILPSNFGGGART